MGPTTSPSSSPNVHMHLLLYTSHSLRAQVTKPCMRTYALVLWQEDGNSDSPFSVLRPKLGETRTYSVHAGHASLMNLLTVVLTGVLGVRRVSFNFGIWLCSATLSAVLHAHTHTYTHTQTDRYTHGHTCTVTPLSTCHSAVVDERIL
jgi:hypothetical protein